MAVIINEARGQSFSGATGLDLKHECFTHEQLFAAAPQTIHLSNVYLFTEHNDDKTTKINCKTILYSSWNSIRNVWT